MSNNFGFALTTSAGVEFTPIVKYHAPSGRCFRIDRVLGADGNFFGEQVDITDNFKAVWDLDNSLNGWVSFVAGSPPSFAMIPMADVGKVPMPAKPSDTHSNGFRCIIKLAPSATGSDGKSIREIAGNSKAFLSGIDVLFDAYKADRGKHPGELPVVMMVKTTPVTSTRAGRSQTFFHPVFEITKWVKRPDDLVFVPLPNNLVSEAPAVKTSNGSAQPFGYGSGKPPATGNATALPPKVAFVQPAVDDDFG